MVRASALYIVIIIALVIGIICSALVVTAYFYRLQYQKKNRMDLLGDNLQSGINILLAGHDESYSSRTLSLFGKENDSVTIARNFWGVYDVGRVKAFIQNDSLSKVFTIAIERDSANWGALYLADDNSPLSVSGNTSITGDAWLPEAEVRPAYTDKAYSGKKDPVAGVIHRSEKQLPPLNKEKLLRLELFFSEKWEKPENMPVQDTVRNSFYNSVFEIQFSKTPAVLKNKNLVGNIVIRSDTSVTLDSTLNLTNVMVFAQNIVVRDGFKGSCQLFATDSINVGKRCKFGYPSCLGVLHSKANPGVEPEISLGVNTDFNGIIFTSNKNKGRENPKIVLEDGVTVSGQIYSDSELMFKGKVKITGSIHTISVANLYRLGYYRNYLIDTEINSNALSPYYLTSPLLPGAGHQKEILQWLE